MKITKYTLILFSLLFGQFGFAQDCGVSISLGSGPAGDYLEAVVEGTDNYLLQWPDGSGDAIYTPNATDSLVCVNLTSLSDTCTAVACYDWNLPIVCSAEIVLSAAGGFCVTGETGAAPYTYQWSTGETTACSGLNFQTDYCVTVTDATACSVVLCDTLANNCSFDFSWADSLGIQYVWVNSSGVAPFSYAWSTGETTNNIELSYGDSSCVTVTDAIGCVNSGCYTAVLFCDVSIQAVSDPSGGYNLIANTTGSSGFSYQWSNGATGSMAQASESGTYCVTATNSNGCVAEDCITVSVDLCAVEIALVSGPLGDYLEATVEGTSDYVLQWPDGSGDAIYTPSVSDTLVCVNLISLSDSCSAVACYNWNFPTVCSAEILPVGVDGYCVIGETGTAPFTYQWSTGETTSCGGFGFQTDYCVTVTDGNACSVVLCDTLLSSCLINLTSTDSLDFQILNVTSTGVAPYIYEWDSGQTTSTITVSNADTACVTITDAVGCINFACYTGIIDSCSVTIESESDPAGGYNLFAETTGASEFTYLWSTGSTNLGILVIEEGEYCVTVSGSSGCEEVACANISFDSCYVNIIQEVAADGDAYFHAYGSAAGAYDFEWSDGSIGPIYYGFPGDSACVTIVDVNMCVASDCALFSDCGVSIEYVEGSPDSTITANVYGEAPFTFSWSTGATTESVSLNGAGAYCVTITDANGCESVDCYGYNVECATAIYEQVNDITNQLTAISTGEAPYIYNWSTGEVTQTITVVPQGSYYVVVTDANGCYWTKHIDYGYDEGCLGFITEEIAAVGANLTITTFPHDFFQYYWDSGDTTQTINVTEPGEYCATIVNSYSFDTCQVCYDYDFLNIGNEISGSVFEFGGNTFQALVELFQIDPTGGPATLMDTDTVMVYLGPIYDSYLFTDLADGKYIVRASGLGGVDVIPTYHFSEMLSTEADIITVPNAINLTYDILFQELEMFIANGPGQINGIVNDELKSAASMVAPNIYLTDLNSHVLIHKQPNADGLFKMSGLPTGEYYLIVDLPGLSPIKELIVITDATVIHDITVNLEHSGITLGIGTVVNEIINVFPNPADQYVQIAITNNGPSQVQYQILSFDGRLVQASKNHSVEEQINVSDLNAGIYLMRVTTSEMDKIVKIVIQ